MRYHSIPAVFIGMLAFLTGSFSVQAVAEPLNPVLDDAFTFKLGALKNGLDGSVTVKRAPLPEIPIDLGTLQLTEDQWNTWARFRWRFADRWALNLHYNRYKTDAATVVATEFNFDGIVFPAGVAVNSDLLADAYVLNVTYDIFRSDRYEAGIGLGLHAFDLELGIAGIARVGDVVEEFSSTSQSLIAPVPNLRIYGTYAFTPKLSVTASAGWLSMSYGEWDGDFLYLDGFMEYRLSDHWGAGLGYQFTDIEVTRERNESDLDRYEVDFNGAEFYITYSF